MTIIYITFEHDMSVTHMDIVHQISEITNMRVVSNSDNNEAGGVDARIQLSTISKEQENLIVKYLIGKRESVPGISFRIQHEEGV